MQHESFADSKTTLFISQAEKLLVETEKAVISLPDYSFMLLMSLVSDMTFSTKFDFGEESRDIEGIFGHLLKLFSSVSPI